GEVLEVDVDRWGLDDLAEGVAGGLERLREVLEQVARLPLDVRAVEWKCRIDARLARYAGLVVARDLAGGEHEIADPRGRPVVREGPRDVRHRDSLHAGRRERRDQIDLHQGVLHEQPGRPDGRPRRRGRAALAPDLV